MFFTFFEFYKWYEIGQSISYIRQIINTTKRNKKNVTVTWSGEMVLIFGKSFHTDRYFEVAILRFKVTLIYLNLYLVLPCNDPVDLETNLKAINGSHQLGSSLSRPIMMSFRVRTFKGSLLEKSQNINWRTFYQVCLGSIKYVRRNCFS